MTKTVCGWCGFPKDGHSVPGWQYCQSKIGSANSSKSLPGGVG